MMGLDVSVTLKRPGFRIKYRKIQKREIPRKHRINREEAMNWLKNRYGVEILE